MSGTEGMILDKINHRQLVNVERLLYRAPYCDIIMMARFNYSISEGSLKKSLAKAKLKYPMVSARIEQDKNGNARFVFDDVPDFQIKVLSKKTDSGWFDQAWHEQKEPFDLKNGPLIKFLLLCSTDSTDLVIICHHSICDGLSLVYLIKDIALFLDAPATEVQPFPLPPSISEENFIVKAKPGWIYKIIIKYLNNSWKKVKTTFSEDDYKQLYKKYWGSRDIGIAFISLSQDMTSALIFHCHKEHVTVNSALTTAFSLAQYDLQGTSQSYLKRALVAINIRKYFTNPPGDNFGFLAAGIQVIFPSGKGSFWNVARNFNMKIKGFLSPKKVLGAMATLNSLNPSFIDAIYFAAYGSFKNKAALRLKKVILTSSDKPRRSMDITNLGMVNIENNSNLETIFFVPILSPNYEKAIGIVTAGVEINIIILHDRSQISSEIILSFKQRIVDYISQAVV
jgi:NRPS condensation-like uncharacterized protein